MCLHVLLLLPLGMSWLVLVDASPRASDSADARELAAGLWVVP